MRARHYLVIAMIVMIFLLLLASCHKATEYDVENNVVANKMLLPQQTEQSILARFFHSKTNPSRLKSMIARNSDYDT